MTNYKNETISVIIPAYNAEKTIERCMMSVLNQSFHDLEVVVIDDGSCDETFRLMQTIAANDRRVVVLHKENGGASSARNEGLRIAKGKYITFLDADDYIEPDIYAQLYAAMIDKQLDIVSASIREIYKGDIVEERVNKPDYPIISGCEALCNMYSYEGGVRTVVWDKLYRRDVVKDILFDEESPYGEDTLFNCQSMLKCRRYGRIPYVGYTYDHRNSQMTNGQYNSKGLCNVVIIEKMQVMIDENASDVFEYSQIWDCLCWYKIMIYKQLFHSMVKANSSIPVKEDYRYLREYARTIDYKIIRTHLGIKSRVLWYVYIYGFSMYRAISLIL